MDKTPFFLSLLRACPAGSRLLLYQTESEPFVHAFREWSYREHAQELEADHYSIDEGFLRTAERLAAEGELEIVHHFTILGPDGRLLCNSLDDFTILEVADDIEELIASARKKPPNEP